MRLKSSSHKGRNRKTFNRLPTVGEVERRWEDPEGEVFVPPFNRLPTVKEVESQSNNYRVIRYG